MSVRFPNHRSYLQLSMMLFFCLFFAMNIDAIVVTEIMYNPAQKDAAYEFIELYNETAARRDLSGWAFIKGIKYVFPQRTAIEPRSYFVIARNPEKLRSKYEIDAPIFGPYKGALNNQKDRIVLVDLAGGYMVDVEYGSRGRWPIAPDGTGHSLSKTSPRLTPNVPENWRASLDINGTPGHDNGLGELMSSPIVINEVSASDSDPFIEIYNRLSKNFDISGYWLSDDANKLKRYQVPQNTILLSHEFLTFRESELGFKLKAKGERLFITEPDGNRVVEAIAYKNRKDMSHGRYPDGKDEWYSISPTRGQANFVNLNPSVVINEIMYHPPTESANDEYIELYNRGIDGVDLSGWSITGGISFDCPDGTTLPADGYLIIGKSRDELISKYQLPPEIVLGDFKGKLSNAGETIRLRDNLGNKVDEVRYFDGGRWSKNADGYGSSLELIDPNQDNGNPQTWAPSDEAQKAEWTHISYESVYEGEGGFGNAKLHIHLLGMGEMLIDDVRITSTETGFFDRLLGDREYMTNGSFERGTQHWSLLGNHIQSHTVGAHSQHGRKCLLLTATGRGNTAPNHVEVPLVGNLKSGQEYTVSFWAKWLWGNNLLVTRALNNQLAETRAPRK